jgi:uncharacterized membrane protein
MTKQLIVVSFNNDRYKATEVLNKLRRLNEVYIVQLQDAVAIHRGRNGELRIDQNYDLTTSQGAGWGAVWGSIVGAIIAISTVGIAAPAVVASAAATGLIGGGSIGAATGAIGANIDRGPRLSEDFVRKVAGTLRSGDSAVFAVLDPQDPKEVVDQFAGFGGTVLATTLSDEQTQEIERVLNTGRG